MRLKSISIFRDLEYKTKTLLAIHRIKLARALAVLFYLRHHDVVISDWVEAVTRVEHVMTCACCTRPCLRHVFRLREK